MLQFPKKKFKFSGRSQSGFYVDFLLKKLAEIFIRNIFILSALFFGEKYMIEYLTKKIVDNFIFNSNMFLGWTNLNYIWFFYVSLSVVLYTLVIVNVYLLFL